MKKILFCYFIFLFLLTDILSGYIIPVQQSARNTGLGFTGVSYPCGITSIFYNPALLLLNKRDQFRFEYTYNNNNSFNYLNAGYLHKWSEKIAGGFNFIYFRSPGGRITEENNRFKKESSHLYHILNGGSAVKINDMLFTGFNLRLINVLHWEKYDNAFNFDMGLLCTPMNNLNLGLNMMNLITTEIEIDNISFREPLNIRSGLAYTLPLKNHGFLLAAEFNSKKDYFPQYSFGFEYTIFNIFSIGLGYNEKTKFTAGTGIKYRSYAINYSFEGNNEYKNHRAALTYYFKSTLTDKKKEAYYNKGIICYNNHDLNKSYEIFNKLYETDKEYRETAYYYELLQKKVKEQNREKNDRLKMADEYYKQAKEYYKQGKYSLSVDKLIESLKKNPKHTGAKELLSEIRKNQVELANKKKGRIREKEGDDYFSASEYPPALVEYIEALKLIPGSKALEKKIEKTKAAINELDTKTISMNLYNEGKSFFFSGYYNKAISKWKEALAANPGFTRINKDIENANREIKENEKKSTLDKIVQDETDDLFKIADEKINRGAYAEALFKVEEILELAPGNKKAKSLKNKIILQINVKKANNKTQQRSMEKKHLREGIASYKKGKFNKALYNFAKVVALNPEKGRSIKELNVVLNQMCTLESSGITENSPNYKLMKTHYNRGMKFFNNDNYQMAAAEWERALAMVPENIKIKMKTREVKELAQKQKNEQFIKFHLSRAEGFLNQNKKELALVEAGQVLAKFPDNPTAKKIVEKCSGLKKRKEGLEKYFKKAGDLADDNKYHPAIRELNTILILDPENKRAKERLIEYHLKSQIIEKENNININLNLANNYLENDNYYDAERIILEILQIDKNNKDAKKILEKIKQKEEDTKLASEKKKKIIDLFNQGITYFYNKKYNKSINIMKKVLISDPDNKQAREFIDKAKTKLKQKSGVPAAKKKINKKVVYQYYLKGINYYTIGDIDKAIKEWKLALKLDPANAKIKRSLNKAYTKKKMLE